MDGIEESRTDSDMFKIMLDNSRDIIYMYQYHPVPRFVYVSPSTEQISGYTPQDHYDNPNLVWDISHPDSGDVIEEIKALKSTQINKPVELKLFRKDGTIFWLEVVRTIYVDKHGEPVGVVGVSRDITEKKELEHQISLLSQILPMCAWCNRLKAADGQWVRIETYIEKTQHRSISHGLCEDCASKQSRSSKR